MFRDWTNKEALEGLDSLLWQQYFWIEKSILYVKRRNTITPSEKLTVYELLNTYKEGFYKLLKENSNIIDVPPVDVIEKAIHQTLLTQVSLNRRAAFYSFPLFALPDYYKKLVVEQWHRVYFEVTNDMLARAMWAGNLLECSFVDPANYSTIEGLIVVIHRSQPRRPRENRIGWFRSINTETLTLAYDRPELQTKAEDWSVPLAKVVHVLKVETISRYVGDKYKPKFNGVEVVD